MTELCDLAFKYGTDKCPQIKHHFTEFYYGLTKDRRQEVKKVVEIGVGNISPVGKGASLYMWQEWFPEARVYGADIEPSLIFKDGRIETFLCDQTKSDDLWWLVAQTGADVDLFIDDGLHTSESQVNTCKALMPMLWENVTYVIEDAARVDTDLLDGYQVEVFTPGRRRKYRDDRLVVVRHCV